MYNNNYDTYHTSVVMEPSESCDTFWPLGSAVEGLMGIISVASAARGAVSSRRVWAVVGSLFFLFKTLDSVNLEPTASPTKKDMYPWQNDYQVTTNYKWSAIDCANWRSMATTCAWLTLWSQNSALKLILFVVQFLLLDSGATWGCCPVVIQKPNMRKHVQLVGGKIWWQQLSWSHWVRIMFCSNAQQLSQSQNNVLHGSELCLTEQLLWTQWRCCITYLHTIVMTNFNVG